MNDKTQERAETPDQMSTDALELYCRNRAKSIGELTEYDRMLLMDVSARLCALQAENGSKDKAIERMAENCTKVVNDATAWKHKYNSAMEVLSRVEAERDRYKQKYEDLGAEYTKLRTDRAFGGGAQGE